MVGGIRDFTVGQTESCYGSDELSDVDLLFLVHHLSSNLYHPLPQEQNLIVKFVLYVEAINEQIIKFITFHKSSWTDFEY